MTYKFLLRTSSVLWIIWGLFHLFVGIFLLYLLMNNRVAEAMNGIAGTVSLESLQLEYPYAVIAALKQHAFNLSWFGLVALVAGVYIWKMKVYAVFLAILVGGLGDLGYFVFIDLAGLAIPPGPQMTWISGTAILLSLYVYFKTNRLTDLQ